MIYTIHYTPISISYPMNPMYPMYISIYYIPITLAENGYKIHIKCFKVTKKAKMNRIRGCFHMVYIIYLQYPVSSIQFLAF